MKHAVEMRGKDRSLQWMLGSVVAFLLVAIYGCTTESHDRVELRSGKTLDGYVEGYAADVLTFKAVEGTRTYARAKIKAITFDVERAGPENIPATGDTRRDRIILRSGALRLSRLEAIDDASVVTRAGRFDRDDVFRIELSAKPIFGSGAKDKTENEKFKAACWIGSIHVRDRNRHPATPEQQVGRKCPISTDTWQGAAQVILYEQFPLGLDGKPSGEVSLRYREIACKLSTPGWERICTAPETYGPGPDDWHRYELGLRVKPAEHLDHMDEARLVGDAGFYFINVEETPSGVWPDAKRHGWQPGQYLFTLPACGNPPRGYPLEVERWHTAIKSNPKLPLAWPNLSPRFYRPWGPIRFHPGNFRELKFEYTDSLCDDEVRFVDDGRVMKGERDCRVNHSSRSIQIYQARWELERVDCDDANLPEPKDWKWPDDPGEEVEWRRGVDWKPGEGVVVPVPKNK